MVTPPSKSNLLPPRNPFEGGGSGSGGARVGGGGGGVAIAVTGVVGGVAVGPGNPFGGGGASSNSSNAVRTPQQPRLAAAAGNPF